MGFSFMWLVGELASVQMVPKLQKWERSLLGIESRNFRVETHAHILSLRKSYNFWDFFFFFHSGWEEEWDWGQVFHAMHLHVFSLKSYCSSFSICQFWFTGFLCFCQTSLLILDYIFHMTNSKTSFSQAHFAGYYYSILNFFIF